jgi:hypothetical protein
LAKIDKVYCQKFLEIIDIKICRPGLYQDCKNCDVIKYSIDLKRNPSHQLIRKPKNPKTKSCKKSQKRKKLIIDCRVARQGILEERCRFGKYPDCEGCPQTKREYDKNSLEPVTLSSNFNEKDLLLFEELLGIPPLSLNLKAIRQLNECKDYIIMACSTIDTKAKRLDIRNELESVLNKGKNFLELVGNLSHSSRFILEYELSPPSQNKGINACPFCMEILRNTSVKDHLRECKCRPEVEFYENNDMPGENDLIDRCYSDTSKILNAANRAIKKHQNLLDKGGRPRLTGYKEGIFKACELFIKNSNKNPSNYYSQGNDEYKGHLLNFIEFFISRVSPLPRHSNYSLGQIIKEFKLNL